MGQLLTLANHNGAIGFQSQARRNLQSFVGNEFNVSATLRTNRHIALVLIPANLRLAAILSFAPSCPVNERTEPARLFQLQFIRLLSRFCVGVVSCRHY